MNEPIYTVKIDMGFEVDSVSGEGVDIELAARDVVEQLLKREKVSQLELDVIDTLASRLQEFGFYHARTFEPIDSMSEHDGYTRKISSIGKYHTFMGDYLIMQSEAFQKDGPVHQKIEDHPANFYYFEKVG